MHDFEFIASDHTNSKNLNSIFKNIFAYLSQFYEGKLLPPDTIIITTIVEKLSIILQHYQVKSDKGLKIKGKKLIDIVLDNNGKNTSDFMRSYITPFYNEFSTIISKHFYALQKIDTVSNELTEYRRFYSPDLADKNKIILLIQEALRLIQLDPNFPARPKKQMIDYLNKTINILYSEKTDWHTFMGRLKEAAIVLGAIGSLISGSESVSNLPEAYSKLMQADKIMVETSVDSKILDAHKFSDYYVLESNTNGKLLNK